MQQTDSYLGLYIKHNKKKPRGRIFRYAQPAWNTTVLTFHWFYHNHPRKSGRRYLVGLAAAVVESFSWHNTSSRFYLFYYITGDISKSSEISGNLEYCYKKNLFLFCKIIIFTKNFDSILGAFAATISSALKNTNCLSFIACE